MFVKYWMENFVEKILYYIDRCLIGKCFFILEEVGIFKFVYVKMICFCIFVMNILCIFVYF